MPSLDVIRKEFLVSEVRRAILAGKCVVVTGWKKSVHDALTRKIEESGRVLFYWNDVPRTFGSSVGLVIPSPLTRATWRESAGRTAPMHRNVHRHNEIKEVLIELGDLILESAKKKPEEKPQVFNFKAPIAQTLPVSQVEVKVEAEPIAAPVTDLATSEVEVVPAVPVPEPTETTEPVIVAEVQEKVESQPEIKPDWDKFSKLFVEKMDLHEDCHVSRVVTGEIRLLSGLGHITNADLVQNGWIKPVLGGLKIGYYMAAPKLLRRAGRGEIHHHPTTAQPVAKPAVPAVATTAPKFEIPKTDPIARARQLIEDGEKLQLELLNIEEEEKRLSARKAEIGRMLEQREKALLLVRQLDELLG